MGFLYIEKDQDHSITSFLYYIDTNGCRNIKRTHQLTSWSWIYLIIDVQDESAVETRLFTRYLNNGIRELIINSSDHTNIMSDREIRFDFSNYLEK